MTDPELSSRYWLCRKVICLVGYYGGFRNVELKSLVFENVECDSMGFWFTFSRSKQRNKLEETTICVPRRQKDWIPCSEDSGRKPLDYDPASVIDAYFEAVMTYLDCKREDLSGGFFKGTHGKAGKRFIRANVGKNTLAQVGIEIATELCLRNPETFTGHCWRRSAGTNASNSGINVTTLMSIMGWSCPKTAMQYVKRSRITSLQMSMYLANVQRRNCSDPFPNQTARRSRKTKFSKKENSSHVVTKTNNSSDDKDPTKVFPTFLSSPKTVDECLDIVQFESEFSTQELLSENVVDSVVVNDVIPGVVETERSVDNRSHSSTPSSSMVSNLSPTTETSSSATPVSTVSTIPFDLSTIDSRLINVLHNLQNHGSVQIHFHFGEPKK